jgi:probable H4MPT-linked C1 transfer pathway protein
MIDLMGWDIGGAHLKAVALAGNQIVSILQKPCPLWLGMGHFHDAALAILAELQPAPDCRHAITMTGELADLFANREAGVFALLHALCEHVPAENVLVFAGPAGFLAARQVELKDVHAIASANWLATGVYAASRLEQGLLLDIGSTSTDLLILRNREVLTRGYTDFERLCHGELVYCGVVRTALMSLAKLAPFEGEWVGLMAEHFATTADVYRLTGELPEYADQTPSADGGEKTATASARRMARLLGRDMESSTQETWKQLGFYYRERQLAVLMDACLRQLSRGMLDCNAPIIGAGVGRFLVQELATRLGHTYLDFSDLHPMPSPCTEFHLADCAPALAVACLARQTYV